MFISRITSQDCSSWYELHILPLLVFSPVQSINQSIDICSKKKEFNIYKPNNTKHKMTFIKLHKEKT